MNLDDWPAVDRRRLGTLDALPAAIGRPANGLASSTEQGLLGLGSELCQRISAGRRRACTAGWPANLISSPVDVASSSTSSVLAAAPNRPW